MDEVGGIPKHYSMKTFLEIGTCDFQTLNFLSDWGWRGVMVEPVKKYLNNIEQKPNIHYLNYAVDWECGTRTMYMASDDIVNQDHDFAGMTSFYQRNNSLVNELVVNTITFEKIFELCDITQIDILKIDAEGHDLELLKMFPFHLLTPKCIQLEHEHIDWKAMQQFLTDKMYYWVSNETDTIAYYAGNE